VVNVLNVLEATAATVFAAVYPRSVINEGVVVLWASATKKFLILLRLHIRCKVVAEDESVGVSIMCMLAIPICDHGVVDVVTALPPFEGASVGHVLVVLGAV